MNKLSPHHIIVAVALFGIAAESAWSEQATSTVPAVPAEQTAPSGTGDVPGYAPTPYWRGYEQRWQPPPRPEPPPRYYGHFDPYYPPYRQYRSVPEAPAVNPLSVELKQTQEQLAAKDAELNTTNEQLTSLQTDRQATVEALQEARALLATKITELDTAREQLATLQAEQQAVRDVMQQAQGETAKASEQLSVVVEEMDILYEVLSKLKARLDLQKTSLQGAVEAGAEENDQGDSAVKLDVVPVQSPATKSVQPEKAVSEQTQVRDDEMAKPEGE